MAIGSDYNSNNSGANNNRQSNDTTYYSRFRIRSKDGKRSLSISFWSGLIILDINDVDNNNGFKSSSLETIRLSPMKARMLASELRALKEYMKQDNIDPNKAFGVNSGLGNEVPYIGFSVNNDEEKTIAATIGKINGSGNILSCQTIVFDNTEYLYALEWDNISKMDVERVQYDHLELDILIDTFDDFGKHMNGALAYSVLDLGRYDNVRMNRRFDAIYDKLGIEKYTPGQGGRSNGGVNNFLNNLSSSNKHSNSRSLDDIEEGLLDD